MKKAFPGLILGILLLSFSPDTVDVVKNGQDNFKFLFKDPGSASLFILTKEDGLTVYADATSLIKKKYEFHVPASQLQGFRLMLESGTYQSSWLAYTRGSHTPYLSGNQNSLPKDPELPLKGIKIALDPGHLAGDYVTARLERKSVQLKKDTALGISENDTLIEGKLTLATALLLKQKLEEKGASVLLTREKENNTAFGKTFERWWKEDLVRCLDSAYVQGHITAKEKAFFKSCKDKKKVFRDYFLQEDLRERARKINAFKPDLTVIIHFNVDETNEGWTKTSKKNFNMVFVPGAIFPGALEKKEARFNMVRLLITSHFSRSVIAAGYLAKRMQEVLKVRLAGPEDAGYLKDNCIYTGTPGVFCRNLALTRLPYSPVVYGETLYQDNESEYSQLSIKQFKNGSVPPRLKQVAEAYLLGIIDFFSG